MASSTSMTWIACFAPAPLIASSMSLAVGPAIGSETQPDRSAVDVRPSVRSLWFGVMESGGVSLGKVCALGARHAREGLVRCTMYAVAELLRPPRLHPGTVGPIADRVERCGIIA
jgi:hypothetical protein